MPTLEDPTTTTAPLDNDNSGGDNNDNDNTPKTALLRRVETVLAASETGEETELEPALLGLGGRVAEILERDGNSVQKSETLAALTQLGIPETDYASLKQEVIAADSSTDNNSNSSSNNNKRGTTPAKKAKKGKKGKVAKPSTPAKKDDTVNKAQFKALIVLGLRKHIESLRQAAAQELRPETIISANDVAKLRALNSPWEQIEQLAQMLGQGDHRAVLRAGVEVDFFVHHLLKCFETDVDDLRTAIFLTVMAQVLDGAREAGWPSPEATFGEFRKHFVKFCANGAGGEYEPFTVAQAHSLTKHVSETFFRFYSSFKFTFTVDQDRDSVFEDVFVEEPLMARPLSEAKQRS